jgi:predicted Mrr-cat superfamily restriction endonuclease
MSIWLLHVKLTPEEEAHIEQLAHLKLPFGDLPDLSMIHTALECRHLLQALYPDEPPEALMRRVERIWPYYSGLQAEDIIAVPLPLRREVALAELTGGYIYRVGVSGADVHLIPVKWHSRRVPFRALRKHAEMLKAGVLTLSEVGNAEARIIIRDRLPHGYNRFVKWKWLLVVFFLMGLVRLIGRLLEH